MKDFAKTFIFISLPFDFKRKDSTKISDKQFKL